MSRPNNQIESLPVSVDDTLAMLNQLFPEMSARLEWSEKEIWFRAGQRSVVNWLLELKRREEDPNSED